MTARRDPVARAAQRDLVRRGYDAVSHAYRSDDGESSSTNAETTTMYAGWIDELVEHLDAGARVLDIGCGNGLPADRLLVNAGMDIIGVDISEVQIARARALVPGATFVCSDIVGYELEPSSFDAIVSLYALIHIPLDDQRELLPRVFGALRPGGLLLAIVGQERWTRVEDYLGAPMFWDHADADAYLAWLGDLGFDVVSHRTIPEGEAGHTLVLARRPEPDAAGQDRQMRVVITGVNLSGRTFCRADGSPLGNVHVGVQVRRDPTDLVRGDAAEAHWELEVDPVRTGDGLDFRGPAVHGKRGERFLYLTWGEVHGDGTFEMFRRAKLMLHRIEPDLVAAAVDAGCLAATVDMTGRGGEPRCARVDPPAIVWTAGICP